MHFRAPTKTFEADEAIDQHLRVKLDADGKVTKAGAGDSDIGTAARPARAAGDDIGINLVSLEGTDEFVAAVAIAVGDKIYGADNGKVGKTNTNAPIGIALTAAAADGVFEALRRQI